MASETVHLSQASVEMLAGMEPECICVQRRGATAEVSPISKCRLLSGALGQPGPWDAEAPPDGLVPSIKGLGWLMTAEGRADEHSGMLVIGCCEPGGLQWVY